MSDRARRIADNERRFRVFNEQVREVGAQLRTAPAFMCECGDPQCQAAVTLSAEEYARVRADPRWFVVLPEHERLGVERVVACHDHFRIVEKIGEGAKLVT
ncbi:hypothetical protein DVA67_016890 [Solirubrobacter sp. CPCC 204708]|uniref:Post-SET domain-containing protein n=1 Tax=Solirubrobacter deserti TaxID=2282478 RepID=A0ABT4RJ79_9ACTN|nr:hypothetical protein [Solirubrobacter deserti]MBE2317661.1 hypothetical protein [Solirubrobacter deserti]MDA0138611.1 hypothetical protein [Solirubrobacter deserti]